MSQLIDRVHARCEDCGQGYRVSTADRVYACKQCGGTVRADEPGEPEEPEVEHRHLDGAITCSECHLINPHGAHFCEECGAVLGISPQKHASAATIQARREARDEFKRGFQWINGITWLYRLAALGFACGTMFAVLALVDAEVPLGTGLVTIGLFTVLTMALVMGAIQVHFHAFAWSVTIASLATLSIAASFFSSGMLSNAFVWSVLWTLVFWAAVVPTVRFRTLVREHPEIYVAHEVQGMEVRRSVEGRSAKQRHDRLQRLLKKATRRAWMLSALASGAFLLATSFGTYTVYANLRLPSLASELEIFRAAWNDSNPAGVEAYFPSERRAEQSERLAALIDGHGWTDAWPQIGTGEVGPGEARVTVDYALDEGTLSTRWNLAKKRWFLVNVELPRPPFEPVFERFLRAWKRSDLVALASFYPPNYQERMQGSLTKSFERRGWSSFPEILETRVTENEDETVSAVLTLESGELTTQWQFGSSGRWSLRAFKLPKR